MAASRVASRSGFASSDPVVLQESNNTVVWLRPHAVIAKVGTWAHSAGTLALEHAVAVVLAADDMPIAPPLAGIAPTRDDETGYLVTLWLRLEHDRGAEVPSSSMGHSLRRVHEGLARYEGSLPSFRVGLDRARAVLADDRKMAALRPDDRSLLRSMFDRLRTDMEAHGYVNRPLHGEPHRGNVLATPQGPRWIDFEGVCAGPLEWDLAFLPDDAVRVFPHVDHDVLGILRTLNSARVATWCWARSEFPEMRRHGEYHVEEVRRAAAR
jgi:hypothetical protein